MEDDAEEFFEQAGRNSAEAVFCAACTVGDVDTVAQMLCEEPTLVGAVGEVREDHREFMRQFGAEGGWTPLHLAGHYAKAGVVRLLLDAGADPNVLSSNLIGNRPLGAAVAGGDAETVAALIAGGANVNASDAGKMTPLQLAASERRHEIVKLLLAGGADRTACDKRGRKAADLAREAGDEVGAALLS